MVIPRDPPARIPLLNHSHFPEGPSSSFAHSIPNPHPGTEKIQPPILVGVGLQLTFQAKPFRFRFVRA